jgi:hypothetical protein
VRAELGQERQGRPIRVWRRQRLIESGFPALLAARLAVDPRFDLHALIELAERGCPPELAVWITAPLEDGPGA